MVVFGTIAGAHRRDAFQSDRLSCWSAGGDNPRPRVAARLPGKKRRKKKDRKRNHWLILTRCVFIETWKVVCRHNIYKLQIKQIYCYTAKEERPYWIHVRYGYGSTKTLDRRRVLRPKVSWKATHRHMYRYHKIETIYTAYTNVQKKDHVRNPKTCTYIYYFIWNIFLFHVHKPTKDLVILSALAGCVLDTYYNMEIKEEEEEE